MIPNKFHFVYLTTKDNIHPMYQEFHLMHYLCIKSAMVVNLPDEINVYCNQEPRGEWWDKIKDDVNIVFVEPPTEIFDIPKTELAHMSDVIRLQALLEDGGIYIDMDTICVRPYTDLLNNKFVMGEQGVNGSEGLCPAVIMSEKDSKFGEQWLYGFKDTFKGGPPGSDGWCTHSVFYPAFLSKEIPQHIHVEPRSSFFYPTYHQISLKDMFETVTSFDKAYSHHLWETCSMKWIENITVDDIKSQDTTFNLIARKLL